MTDVLDSGQAIMLFDGVDEVHRDQRTLLAEEIGELIRTYPDCIYVITTRPGAVEPGWLDHMDFIEAHVEPMSRRDRDEFIDKWYSSAALELKQRPRPGENLLMTANRLKGELVEQPELGLLATNPLLCAMICALYRERQEKLPETPAELSEALCNMLLHRRERETPGLADNHFLATWRVLQYPQKKGLLSELAWYMMTQGDSSIEVNAAKILVAETLSSTPGRTKEEADDVVQALVERSGLLRPASDERIDFLHNTLKEYLAACRVVEEMNWEGLSTKADDPAWQPVILFALALAPEPFSTGLVGKLLTQITSIKKPVKKVGNLTKIERKTLISDKARQFFLVRCRAIAKRLASNLTATIDGFLKHLLPPASMNEVEALAQLGPRILTYSTTTLENGSWWARQNCHMVARCLRLIRLIGGPRAKAILKIAKKLPSYSSQVNNEWLLACNELMPDERIPWPFVKFEDVVNLHFSSSAIKDISRLDDLASLRYLDLDGTSVKSISPLIGLTSLQRLSLSRTLVTDITPLSDLKLLQILDVSKTPISDIRPLIHLDSLKRIIISNTKVCDLSPLSAMKTLQLLDFGSTQVNDLQPLAELISLKHLTCWNTKITDLSPLASLTTLQGIDISATQVVDLHPLAGLTSLKRLSCWRTKVSDIGPISELISLEYLDLEGTLVTDFRSLANLTLLKNLDLSGTIISDLSPLSELVTLQYLDLRGTPVADFTPLNRLASLKVLNLYGTQVNDLSPILEIASLKSIILKQSSISGQQLERIKAQRPNITISIRK